MMANIGSPDKIFRIIAGLLLISMLFWVDSAVKYIGLFGFVLIITAVINFCPVYALFGLSTMKKVKRTEA